VWTKIVQGHFFTNWTEKMSKRQAENINDNPTKKSKKSDRLERSGRTIYRKPYSARIDFLPYALNFMKESLINGKATLNQEDDGLHYYLDDKQSLKSYCATYQLGYQNFQLFMFQRGWKKQCLRLNTFEAIINVKFVQPLMKCLTPGGDEAISGSDNGGYSSDASAESYVDDDALGLLISELSENNVISGSNSIENNQPREESDFDASFNASFDASSDGNLFDEDGDFFIDAANAVHPIVAPVDAHFIVPSGDDAFFIDAANAVHPVDALADAHFIDAPVDDAFFIDAANAVHSIVPSGEDAPSGEDDDCLFDDIQWHLFSSTNDEEGDETVSGSKPVDLEVITVDDDDDVVPVVVEVITVDDDDVVSVMTADQLDLSDQSDQSDQTVSGYKPDDVVVSVMTADQTDLSDLSDQSDQSVSGSKPVHVGPDSRMKVLLAMIKLIECLQKM
jgi:hypothetical protein